MTVYCLGSSGIEWSRISGVRVLGLTSRDRRLTPNPKQFWGVLLHVLWFALKVSGHEGLQSVWRALNEVDNFRCDVSIIPFMVRLGAECPGVHSPSVRYGKP